MDPLLCDEAVGFLPVLLIVVHFDPSVGLLVPETAEVVSDPLFLMVDHRHRFVAGSSVVDMHGVLLLNVTIVGSHHENLWLPDNVHLFVDFDLTFF